VRRAAIAILRSKSVRVSVNWHRYCPHAPTALAGKGHIVTDVEALARIGVATLLGATLGLERERSGKPAGLRTHMLVAEGAALFMVGSILLTEQYIGVNASNLRIDVTRVASTIVTGIGFLGAGAILRSGDRVHGLTTAAGIWVAAAIGTLVGAGIYVVPVLGTIIGLGTLIGVQQVERRLTNEQPVGSYDVEQAESARRQDDT